MERTRWTGVWIFVALAGVMPGVQAQVRSPSPALAFRLDEGHNLNSFFREGPVAAHLLLRSGAEPRILVAFPAGNSGVGLWFESARTPMSWTLVKPPRAVTVLDEKQRSLRGVEFDIETAARELRPRGAVLSSVRVLRDYELQQQAPAEVMTGAQVTAGKISWARDRLDGAAGYRLEFTALEGTQISADRFAPATGKKLRLRVQAFTGEPPLTPLPELLAPNAAADPRARNALAFLSYREKFLAGSWRFDTYFGRDTLISAMLLAPVLEPAAMESAISSVLDRLAPNGEVAHEEDIGEFAVLRNAREGRGRSAAPIYDYGMVDDDFMLAPLAARWLLDDPRGAARAKQFLEARSAGGESRGVELARNLAWLVERTAPFAESPIAKNLVGNKPGRMTGNWRDSQQGLGGGRYAYDVNAALVPAALAATARLAASGVLDQFMEGDQPRKLGRAAGVVRAWKEQAPALFDVEIPVARARTAVAAYGKAVGVPGDPAQRALEDAPLQFHALSLDDDGKPIPILHSDEGFRLLFTEPPAEEIARCLDAIFRPFPAGLMTDAGMLVANPALANAQLQADFDRFAYHGTVVWSWQQALMVAGLDRQLARDDLPAPLHARLASARAALWKVIARASSLRTSELWSWSYARGQYRAQPFGRPGADADESNAAQLWSTVYLGLATRDTSPGN